MDTLERTYLMPSKILRCFYLLDKS